MKDRREYKIVEDSRESLMENVLAKNWFLLFAFDQDLSCLLGPAVADGQNESDKQGEERSVAGIFEQRRDDWLRGWVRDWGIMKGGVS